MKRLLVLLCCFCCFSVNAQIIACRDSVRDAYDFWLYLPDDYVEEPTPKPVVIFLHGRSLSGTDLTSVLRYGCLDALRRGREIDAIVLAPQTNNGWSPEKVMRIYDWTRRHYAVDTARLYVLGMSMGGYGTMDFVATYPDKVAAAMALCGGCTKKDVCGLNEVPLWIVHGTADTAVPVSQSEKVVNDMIQCGDTSLLRFDKMKGVQHGTLARIFYLEQTYDWLFSHALTDSVRQVNKEYDMSRSVLQSAYSDLVRNQTLKLIDARPRKSSASSKIQYHIVKNGDTLSSIAKKHKTTVSKLCQLNRITEAGVLRVGQRVRVK